jgi:hypothetical protein
MTISLVTLWPHIWLHIKNFAVMSTSGLLGHAHCGIRLTSPWCFCVCCCQLLLLPRRQPGVRRTCSLTCPRGACCGLMTHLAVREPHWHLVAAGKWG